MYILIINQSNGTTIKPLSAKSMVSAKIEEEKILEAGGYTGHNFKSEIVAIHRNGTIDQTYRDKHPIHGCEQSAIWVNRQCAFIPASN